MKLFFYTIPYLNDIFEWSYSFYILPYLNNIFEWSYSFYILPRLNPIFKWSVFLLYIIFEWTLSNTTFGKINDINFPLFMYVIVLQVQILP